MDKSVSSKSVIQEQGLNQIWIKAKYSTPDVNQSKYSIQITLNPILMIKCISIVKF